MTKTSSKSSSKKNVASNKEITAEQRYKMIAEAAYYIAEKRDFEGGDHCKDWEIAETQVNTMLSDPI